MGYRDRRPEIGALQGRAATQTTNGNRCILDKERPGCEKDGGDNGICRDLEVPASVYFSKMIGQGPSQVRTCCTADAEDRAKYGSHLGALHGVQSYQE